MANGPIDTNSIGVPEQATASTDKCAPSFLPITLGEVNLSIDASLEDSLTTPQTESTDYGGIELETGTDGFQDVPDMDRHAPLGSYLSGESFMPPVNLEQHMLGLNSGDSMPAEMSDCPCTTDRQYLAVTPITPMEEQGSSFPAKTGKPEVQCDHSSGERVTVQYKLPSYCQTMKEDGDCYCMVVESLNRISRLGHFVTTPLPRPFPVQEIVHPLDSRYLTCNPMDGKYCKCRDYVKQKVIGYGGQGTCFCATDRKSEKTFAYKENYRSTDDTKLLAECAMMSQINHDNVVVFLGAVKEDMSKVKLFMELAEYGSVHRAFSKKKHRQTDTLLIAHLLQQLLSAVNHLHQNNILHRDIKGKNLLLFDGCVCKLADFGMAVHLDDCRGVQDAGVKGTYPFLSPEYMREQVYQFSADVWSSMAVAVEMMTGKDPWNAINQNALVLTIGNYRARDHFHQLVPQQELEQRVKEAEEAEGRDLAKNFDALVDMMKKVFVEDHVLRPTAQDLLCEDVMLKGKRPVRWPSLAELHVMTGPEADHEP